MAYPKLSRALGIALKLLARDIELFPDERYVPLDPLARSLPCILTRGTQPILTTDGRSDLRQDVVQQTEQVSALARIAEPTSGFVGQLLDLDQ